MDVSSHAEPLIRCDTVSGGDPQADDQIGGGSKANPIDDQEKNGKIIYNSEPDVAEKSLEVRRALSGRMLRHTEGSNGGPVPVAWLTVACEKELLRHIRLFPRYLGNSCVSCQTARYRFQTMGRVLWKTVIEY